MGRLIAVWSSIFLIRLWYLFAMNPHLLPENLIFIGIDSSRKILLFLQF